MPYTFFDIPAAVRDEAAVRAAWADITRALIARGLTITTMESCTSGQLASLITDTEGASAVMKGAFVTYSNEVKILEGVPEEIIARFGVYSAQTAAAMAETCRAKLCADIGVGVTGSFGNADPNNPDSVPGEVYFALAGAQGVRVFHCVLPPQPSRLAYKLCVAGTVADYLPAEWTAS